MENRTLSLIYFDSPFWRAEVPRLTLFIGGIAYEDRRIDAEAFRKLKEEGKLPFGQVPVLFVNGTPVAQSGGICRFAGKLAGLYPKDDLSAAKVDEVIDFCSDITSLIGPSMRESDAAKKQEMRAVLAAKDIPERFAFLENLLKANGNTNFFVGRTLTVADLCVWRLYHWITGGTLDGITFEVAKPFSLLRENVETVDAHPKVIEWKAKHSKFYK